MSGKHTETTSEPTEKKEIESRVTDEIAQQSRLRRERLQWYSQHNLRESTENQRIVRYTWWRPEQITETDETVWHTWQRLESVAIRGNLWRQWWQLVKPRKECPGRGCQLKGSIKNPFYAQSNGELECNNLTAWEKTTRPEAMVPAAIPRPRLVSEGGVTL